MAFLGNGAINSATFILFCCVFLHVICIADAISHCGEACNTLNDCYGSLICIQGVCDDDPDIGSNNCNGGGGCSQSGTLVCEGTSYPTYTCSPSVTSSTSAILTHNSFEEGGDGGDPSQCDEKFHSNSELIVALSTGWYDGGSLCGGNIKIMANGRSVLAKVVDQCDSLHGCDSEHAGQPPCKNNVVDGSKAVWDALGLDTDVGVVSVTWTPL